MLKLALVTDISNGAFEEDKYLGELLGRSFQVTVLPVERFKEVDLHTDIVLIRNIWPSHDSADLDRYRTLARDMRLFFRSKGLRMCNDESGSADIQGKDYLINLFKKGCPVVSSIDSMKDFRELPAAERYVVKPKNGLSAVGLRVVNKKALFEENPQNAIIQPCVDFTEESCFFFIDGDFQYAVKTPNRQTDIQSQEFDPEEEDIALAERFVKWNTLRRGLQRIDFCRTKSGELLLMEIEDDSPYLFLLDLREKTRERFILELARSLSG